MDDHHQEPRTGFRFYPTEEELISFYLLNKLESTRQDSICRVIPDFDIYSTEPWHLPRFAAELCRGDTEQWFFFTPRQQREAQGGRPKRTTASGYWKATGSPGYVYSSDNRVIGVRKTMVFYKGKAPSGRKTKWKMNEYRAIESSTTTSNSATTSFFPKLRDEFRLCRVYIVSGSSRAFDRRPMEVTGAVDASHPRQSDPLGASTSSSSQQSTMVVEKTSSSSTDDTHSNSGDFDDFQADISNWEMNNDLQQPLWEWEQLNLL